jgi:hypothetical protein
MNLRVQSWASALFAILWFLTGCVNIAISRKPDVNALEQSLQIGESTRDDVRRVLGEPFGNGQSLYPWDGQVRETWIYYYAQATMNESHRLVLFVYFDQEKFGGYMWWSSLPEESKTKAVSGAGDRAAFPRVVTTM